jgi:hypothetical protein
MDPTVAAHVVLQALPHRPQALWDLQLSRAAALKEKLRSLFKHYPIRNLRESVFGYHVGVEG